MVTPCSSRRLSAGRNSFMPSRLTTASPGAGSARTEISAARPEHPPGLTESRKPAPGAPSAITIIRMNFAALGVISKFMLSSLSLVEMADALSAFRRIDDEGSALFGNGHVRTFRFAGRATRALRGDDFIRH